MLIGIVDYLSLPCTDTSLNIMLNTAQWIFNRYSYWVFPLASLIGSDVTLSLRFLKLFEWKDEHGAKKQLKIIETISSQWRDLAILVGLSVSQMDGILRESFMNSEQCCLRVFDHWIMSNGEFTDYPVTWSGLHKLLKDIGHHNALAEHMKSALQTIHIDT